MQMMCTSRSTDETTGDKQVVHSGTSSEESVRRALRRSMSLGSSGVVSHVSRVGMLRNDGSSRRHMKDGKRDFFPSCPDAERETKGPEKKNRGVFRK